MCGREALALGFHRAEGKQREPHISSGARRLAQVTAGQLQLSLWGREGLSKQEVHHPDADVSLISAKPFRASFSQNIPPQLGGTKMDSASSLPNRYAPEKEKRQREAGRWRGGKEQKMETEKKTREREMGGQGHAAGRRKRRAGT